MEPASNVHVYRGLEPNSPTLLWLFAEADIFVLPSLGECLAVALMEAAAAGLPIITTRVGALPEAVDHGCPPVYADPTHDPRMQQRSQPLTAPAAMPLTK